MIPTARNVSPAHHWHAETCHLPGRGSSWFPHFTLRGAARLSLTARIGRAPFYRARSASTKDGLAAPPPALLRPRVARARGSSQPPRPLFSILLVLRCAVGRGIRRWSRVGGGAFAHQRREFGEFVHPLV